MWWACGRWYMRPLKGWQGWYMHIACIMIWFCKVRWRRLVFKTGFANEFRCPLYCVYGHRHNHISICSDEFVAIRIRPKLQFHFQCSSQVSQQVFDCLPVCHSRIGVKASQNTCRFCNIQALSPWPDTWLIPLHWCKEYLSFPASLHHFLGTDLLKASDQDSLVCPQCYNCPCQIASNVHYVLLLWKIDLSVCSIPPDSHSKQVQCLSQVLQLEVLGQITDYLVQGSLRVGSKCNIIHIHWHYDPDIISLINIQSWIWADSIESHVKKGRVQLLIP